MHHLVVNGQTDIDIASACEWTYTCGCLLMGKMYGMIRIVGSQILSSFKLTHKDTHTPAHATKMSHLFLNWWREGKDGDCERERERGGRRNQATEAKLIGRHETIMPQSTIAFVYCVGSAA